MTMKNLFLGFLVLGVVFSLPTPNVSTDDKPVEGERSSTTDARSLYTALHDGTVDTTTVMNILAKRTYEERLHIIDDYQYLYDVDLVGDLKDKLSGDFKRVIVALVTHLPQLFAAGLNAAVVGLGTNEDALSEILITLDSDLVKLTSEVYYNTYQETLEDAINEDTNGFYRDFLVELSHGERDESAATDEVDASYDAEMLFEANETLFTTFNDVFTHRSFAQLPLIFDYYEIWAGHKIEDGIEDKFSGDIVDGLLAVVEIVRNEPAYFAKRLFQSMDGWGTNDSDLTRLVVTRSEIDIDQIKIEYKAQYSTSLADAIISETSGDYQTCLLILIGAA